MDDTPKFSESKAPRSHADYTVPALGRYIDRVNAEQRSFRRYVVLPEREEGDHYARARIRTTITVSEDGTLIVKAPSEDHPDNPTDAERAAIKEDFAQFKIEFPKPRAIHISECERQRDALGVAPKDWFMVPEPTNPNKNKRDIIIMCWERKDSKDGSGKVYLPSSYWTAAKGYHRWNMMEPIEDADGRLAFWKPVINRQKFGVMIHEGAKAAQFADKLVNSNEEEWKERRAKHPWAEILSHYEHWGWNGGAPNPGRTEWGDVKRSVDVRAEIVLVCDNDTEGRSAAGPIARALSGCKLSIVMFDGRFPTGFDIADTLPEFKDGVPALTDFLIPAIWATERDDKTKGEKRGPVPYRLRKSFTEEWAYAVPPAVFVSKRNRCALFLEKDFNSYIRPLSDVEDTARLVKNHLEMRADGLCYKPGHDTFFFHEKGQRLINTWKIRPEPGDDAPWLDFMEYLIPDVGDRNHTLKWAATLIATDVRLRFALLLIGRQGLGKSTLIWILIRILGLHNCSIVNETMVVEDKFDSWKARRRLIAIHEIYQGQSRKAYKKLQDTITEDCVMANEKFVKKYHIELCCAVIAASNSNRALKLPKDDRRWLVPKLTKIARGMEYWLSFNKWLDDGGLSIIFDWATKYVEKHGALTTANEAPRTKAKSQLIDDTMTPGQSALRDLAAAMNARARLL
jgi:hypothetical protein